MIQVAMCAWDKSTKPGFSLIEILVALAIISSLIALAPRMFRGADSLETAWGAVKTLSSRAQLEALAQARDHRIFIQVPADGPLEIFLQEPDPTDPTNSNAYRTLAQPYAHVTLPDDVTISECIINGTNEMSGGVLTSCWIFVYSDGTTQEATLALSQAHEGRSIRYTLNPLYVIWQ